MSKNLSITLDLGCGRDKIAAATHERVIGIDHQLSPDVDLIANLESPLPLADNSVDKIYSNHTFEHLAHAKQLIEDCWRITKSQGQIFIRVPHYSHNSMYTDLTHQTFFSSRSLDYYLPGTYLEQMSGYPANIRFNLIQKRIFFDLPYKPLEFLVNLNNTSRKIYEWFFAWIFPARELVFILSPIKSDHLTT